MVCSSVHVVGWGCWSVECREAGERKAAQVMRRVESLRGREILGTPLTGLLALTSPSKSSSLRKSRAVAMATLVGEPVLFVARTLVFYAFLHVGLTGRLPSEAEKGWGAWLQRVLFGDSGKKKSQTLNDELRFRTKWHASTKGTLIRRYRVPTVSQGRKLLNSISSLLASDDTFTDASSHKGCQIRRENAHAESVCCHNVRALLDELPTPHLVVEITVFPAGPITESQYHKAAKIEQVLRTGASI